MLFRLMRRGLLMKKGLLAGSLGLVVSKEGKVLFAKHRMRKTPWGLPGGLIERKENPVNSLMREFVEEFGFDSDPVDWKILDAVQSHEFPLLEVAFVYQKKVDEGIFKVSASCNEIEDLGWFNPHQPGSSPRFLKRHQLLATAAIHHLDSVYPD